MTPHYFDNIPPRAAKDRFKFLYDFAIAAHRAIQSLQVAIDNATGSPSTSKSTIAGMRLFGAIFKKDGANCAPSPILTGTILCGNCASRKNIAGFCPFGVGQ